MDRFGKRQVEVSRSIIHVTVTAAGTVVYTQTATSYSYVPSYSTITPTSISTPNNNNNNNNNENNSNSSLNTNALIGGVVGGVGLIALIGLIFLFLRCRSRKHKNSTSLVIDDHDSYYEGSRHHRSSSKATILGGDMMAGVTMTLNTPTPRHLVAPLSNGGNNPYNYDDTFPKPSYYYYNNESVSTDSTTVDGTRHVPNEVDTAREGRHVPHLKDEPPHTKD